MTLQPGDNKPFVFWFGVGHAFKARAEKLKFVVSYAVAGADIERSHSSTVEMRVLPSMLAVPAGGVVGGVIGYVARLALLGGSSESAAKTAMGIVGCAVVALLLTLLTARRPDSFKAVVVEDFWGGVVVGALAGLFTQEIVQRLHALVAGPPG